MPKAPKVEPPSKQYRTSAYTVRQYSALPYAQRMAVDAECTAQAAATRAAAEGNQKTIPAGRVAGDSPTDSETPDQSSPTHSQELAMQLATADLATEEVDAETTQFSPELDDQEPAPEAAPVAATPPAEALPYDADILTVASEFVTLHEHSGSSDWTHWGPTPLADSEGVQFALNAHKNTYKCFASSSAGGIVAFVKALKKLSYAEALEWLSVNYPLPSEPGDLPEPEESEAALGGEAIVCVHRPSVASTPSPVQESQPVAPEPTHGIALDGGTYQTTDYDMFHLLPENRPVDLGHVRKLIAMIIKTNLLHVKPLDVTMTMGVIDGQHRLAAARQLGLTVFYKVSQELSEADITTLNVAQKNWTGADWLHYWTVKGLPDYMTMSSFMVRHPKLSFSNAKLMLGESAKAGSEEFRAGRWKAGPADKAEQVAILIEQVTEQVPTFKQPSHSGFVAAVFYCIGNIEGFDPKEFMRTILLQPRALVPCASHKQFMETFDFIYNYRKTEARSLRFV